MLPAWETLNKLSNSRLAKLTIIAPIAGWALVYNDAIGSMLSSELKTNLEPNLDWKLHVFYIGLILISISVIAFSIWCPKIISNYGSFVSYAVKERPLFTVTHDKALSSELGIPPLNWKIPPQEHQTLADEVIPHQVTQVVNEDSIIEQLRIVYDKLNYSKRAARLVVSLAFFSGAIMSVIPTASTVGWSICSTINSTSLLGKVPNYVKNACAAKPGSVEDVLEDM
jgi:hypothetical protein